MKRKAYKLKKDLRVTLVCRVAPETMRQIKQAARKEIVSVGMLIDDAVSRLYS